MGFICPVSKLFQWKTSFSIKKINHTKYLAVLCFLSLSDSTKMLYMNVQKQSLFSEHFQRNNFLLPEAPVSSRTCFSLRQRFRQPRQTGFCRQRLVCPRGSQGRQALGTGLRTVPASLGVPSPCPWAEGQAGRPCGDGASGKLRRTGFSDGNLLRSMVFTP